MVSNFYEIIKVILQTLPADTAINSSGEKAEQPFPMALYKGAYRIYIYQTWTMALRQPH